MTVNEFEQALAILTKQAARLVQSAGHSVPGQAHTALAALENHAMKLTEARLMTLDQLSAFFDVTHSVTKSNIALVYLTGPVEDERIEYVQRLIAADRAKRAAVAV